MSEAGGKKGGKKDTDTMAASLQDGAPYSSVWKGTEGAEGNGHTQGSVRSVQGLSSHLSQRRQEWHSSSCCSWIFLFTQISPAIFPLPEL